LQDENESDDEEVLPKEKSKKEKNKKKSKKRRKPSSSTRSSSRVPLHITSTGKKARKDENRLPAPDPAPGFHSTLPQLEPDLV